MLAIKSLDELKDVAVDLPWIGFANSHHDAVCIEHIKQHTLSSGTSAAEALRIDHVFPGR